MQLTRSLLALAPLLLSVLSSSQAAPSANPSVQRYEALTRPLELSPGGVTNSFHHLPIPKGPIAVYRFQADVVEKNAAGEIVPVPTFDAYLHHHVVVSNHHAYNASSDKWAPMKPANYSRSVGFGAGTEARGTPQEFYHPYAFLTVEGEDEWIANVHIINTRKMVPALAHKCLECPCTSEDVFTNNSVNGMHFDPMACNADLRFDRNTVCSAATYYGGLRCCEDQELCLEPEQLDEMEDVTSTYYLRYSLEYAEVVPENHPLQVAACCDASGDLNHHGNIEYDVPECDPEIHPGCVHTLATRQRLDYGANSFYNPRRSLTTEDRDVELVYAVGHQHRGGLGIHVFNDNTGELLCSSVPSYGTGKVAGNEDGYVISMSTCTFDPPVKMRASSILRVVAMYNNTVAHTGVMSLMYLAISDVETPVKVKSSQGNAALNESFEVSDETSATDSWTEFFLDAFAVGVVLAAVGTLGVVVLSQLKKRRGYTPLAAPTGSSNV